MRVIRPGRVPDRTIQATCHRCRARLEFLPEEARDVSDLGDQRSFGLVAVRCPDCGSEVVGKERRD